jgi:uncharacterized protein
MTDQLAKRFAVFHYLTHAAPNHELGRTALMKLTYFLDAVCRVRLGYNFRLHSYGPFDSSVLQDVDLASRAGVLDIDMVAYPKGYGYVIRPVGKAPRSVANAFVNKHKTDIDWVVKYFANRSAADLELASTIVFINKEVGTVTVKNLVSRVREIKPHFSVTQIESEISGLKEKHIVSASISKSRPSS